MKKTDFLILFDRLLEVEPGTLSGEEALSDIANWDSLALVGFIALVDEQFGVSIPAKDLTKCKTVNQLIGLLDGNIQT